MKDPALLVIDAVINLALGLLLLFFSRDLAAFLAVPIPETTFYASILGAVLAGIGVALLVERFRASLGVPGLGLGGAIAINVCGAGALAVWLVIGDLALPVRGYVFLWAIAGVVLALTALELAAHLRGRSSV